MKRTMIVLLLAFVAGCTSYHKVTDLNTGKVYYTKDMDYKGGGAVKLKDGQTGTTVVLPSSQVQKIHKDDYKRGIYSSQG